MILGANKQQSQCKDGNFGTSHGEKILRPGNHLLAELCVRARVFSSQDAESGVLEISGGPCCHTDSSVLVVLCHIGCLSITGVQIDFRPCRSVSIIEPPHVKTNNVGPNRFDTNQAVQSQKQARSSKFWI